MESEEEKFEKWYQARRKKELAEGGINSPLRTETGQPAGAALSDEQIRDNFIKDSNDPKARNAFIELERRKRGF